MFHLSVVCLNYDGNIFDLCLLSALAALEDTVLPSLGEGDAKADEPGRLVEVPSGSQSAIFEGRRMALISRPFPVTFAQMPGGHWVLDPSGQEAL